MVGFDAQITFCHTDDLTGTARSYEEVLGLSLALDQRTCRIDRVAGSTFPAAAGGPRRPGRTG
jgi:hypothetical protein